jgi:hypothetical protein
MANRDCSTDMINSNPIQQSMVPPILILVRFARRFGEDTRRNIIAHNQMVEQWRDAATEETKGIANTSGGAYSEVHKNYDL